MPISSSRISRYAHAFVSAVLNSAGEESLDRQIDENRTFSTVWLESLELQKALGSPAIPASERRAVIAQLCIRLNIGMQTRNLLFVLSDRRLLHNHPAVADLIEVLCEKRLGVERVEITSSRELEKDECDALKAQIEFYRESKIKLKHTVDSSVLGGIRMQIGSTVWDGTIKGRLDRLFEALCKGDLTAPLRRETDPLDELDSK